MTKLQEQKKEINLLFLFTVWFKATGYNKVVTSSAVNSLQKFNVADLNWDKQGAGDKISWYFNEY